MKDKKAIEILLNLVEKYSLKKEEKEAVLTAIGILSWSSLSEGRLKALKAKRNKDRD